MTYIPNVQSFDIEGNTLVHVKRSNNAFGQIKTSEDTLQIQVQFPYSINSRIITVLYKQIKVTTTVSTGSGSGATLDITINTNKVVYAKINNGGNNYKIDDILTIGTGGATIRVSSVNNGTITGLDLERLTPGSGYTNSGSTVTQENSMMKLSTNSANEGAIAITRSTIKYQPGTGVSIIFTAIFTNGVNGSSQFAGIGSETDGLFVGYKDETFGILHRQNGIDNFITKSNFNVNLLAGSKGPANPISITLDPTKGNIYRIQYQGLGFGAIIFSVEDPISGGFETFHIIGYANKYTLPAIYNPTLPIRWEVTNTTNNPINLSTSSASAYIEGKRVINGPTFDYYRDGNLTYIFSLRNKAFYQSKPNRINVLLKSISYANTDNSSLTIFSIIENVTFSGTPTWTSINTDSVVEFNTSATYTGGTTILSYVAPKDTGGTVDIFSQMIQLKPGETLSIVSSIQVQCAFSVIWVEDT
jgi:hypothetical protein